MIASHRSTRGDATTKWISFILPALAALCFPSTLADVESLRGTSDAIGPCPTWHLPGQINGSTVCECGNTLNDVVRCLEENSTSLRYGYCMTYNERFNDSILGACPFNPLYSEDSTRVYVTLPQNVTELTSFVCGPLNRCGQLCGRCLPGYSPGVLSYRHTCVSCTAGSYTTTRILVLLSQILLAAVLFLTVTTCNCRLSLWSGTVGAFVFFSQVISLPILADFILVLGKLLSSSAGTFAKILLSFYGIWNLQFLTPFFTDFCLCEDASSLDVLAFDYFVPVCLLFVILAVFCGIKLHERNCRPIVCLCKPFHRCSLIVRRKSVRSRSFIANALATLLLLSFARITSISLQILYWVQPVRSSGERIGKTFLFYDATVELAGPEHLPFLVVAAFVLATFVILPTFILTFYQFKGLQKGLKLLRLNRRGLTDFVAAFQGSYKNGLDGHSDFRYFAGLYLIVRILIIALMLWGYTSTVSNFVTILISLCLILLFSLLRPHRRVLCNAVESVMSAVFLAFFAAIFNLLTLRLQSTETRPKKWESVSIAVILVIMTLPAGYAIAAVVILVCRRLGVRTLCVRGSSGPSSSTQPPSLRNDEVYLERDWSPLIPENSLELSRSSSMPDRVVNPYRYESLDSHSAAGFNAEFGPKVPP